MGRLIPTGTGMKFYRNVEIAYDPTVNQKQEREDDYMPIITGGLDLPEASLDIPMIESDMEGFSIEDVDGEPYIEETEESFDIEVADEVLVDDLDDTDF